MSKKSRKNRARRAQKRQSAALAEGQRGLEQALPATAGATPNNVLSGLRHAFPNSDTIGGFLGAAPETTAMALRPQTRDAVRDLARDKFLNVAHAAGIPRLFALYVVGEGPRLKFAGFEKYLGKTAHRDLAAFVEARWAEFARKIGLASLMRQAMQNIVVDGEAFLAISHNPRLRYGETVVLLDSRRIGNPRNEYPTRDLIDGVYFDRYGNVDKYCVYKPQFYPQIDYISTEYDVVSHEKIFHLFRRELPNQVRGVSWFAPVLDLLIQLNEYVAAVTEAAKSGARCFAAITTQGGMSVEVMEEYFGLQPQQGARPSRFDTPNGQVLELGAGRDIKAFTPSHPTTASDAFIAQILSQIGYALGLPRNKATGSSHEYNFASGRLDNQPFELLIRTLQRDIFETYFIDRLFERFYKMMYVDILERFDVDEAPAPDDIEWQWIWPNPPLIEPEAAARTNALRVKGLQATVSEIYAETHPGGDFDDVRGQILRDRAEFPELYGATVVDKVVEEEGPRFDVPSSGEIGDVENIPATQGV